ncbi:hypothetical protein BJ878DRAFT_569543 [Calycina marina]|uniref:Uncharacterized protein n=1 Tax=Calycina marina TaxID=1763456 RepID=A0A9P7YYU1_9HELO|nr:hypothetical protein BJ878DRAFT_569543 [Calycina marina]
MVENALVAQERQLGFSHERKLSYTLQQLSTRSMEESEAWIKLRQKHFLLRKKNRKLAYEVDDVKEHNAIISESLKADGAMAQCLIEGHKYRYDHIVADHDDMQKEYSEVARSGTISPCNAPSWGRSLQRSNSAIYSDFAQVFLEWYALLSSQGVDWNKADARLIKTIDLLVKVNAGQALHRGLGTLGGRDRFLEITRHIHTLYRTSADGESKSHSRQVESCWRELISDRGDGHHTPAKNTWFSW